MCHSVSYVQFVSWSFPLLPACDKHLNATREQRCIAIIYFDKLETEQIVSACQRQPPCKHCVKHLATFLAALVCALHLCCLRPNTGGKKEITDIATKTFISTAGKRFTSCPTEAKASTFPVLSFFSVAYKGVAHILLRFKS